MPENMPDKISQPLRHAILGAGGVGGMIGACVAHAGASVTLIVRPEAVTNYPKQLHLESPFGKFTVDVAVATEVPPVDVIPATIAGEMERVSPGHIVHRTPFARLNVLSAGRDLLAGTLDQLQHIGFNCRFIDDEPTLMWGKLVFLAPFALCTTAADKTVGEVLSDPQWRSLGEACVRETCAVGVAEGAKVDPGMVLSGVAAMPANMRSSMQKDVEQHKTPELEAIAGPILRGADHHGIEVPATRKLVADVEHRAAK